MSAPVFEWTEARVDELIRLWRTGLTTYQMADHFGVSRNTICGKLHRTKIARGIIEKKPSVPRHSKPDKPPRRKPMLTLPGRAEFAIPKHTFVALPKPDEGQLASIVDVTGCRWAVSFDASAPGGHLFCNHATDGGAYCPYHSQENVASYSRRLIRETVRSAIIVNKRAA